LLASDFCLQCGPITIDKVCIKAVFRSLESKIETLKHGRRESFIDAQSPGLLRERDELVLEMGDSMAFSLISFAGQRSGPRSIYELCSRYGGAECEDQRDKIFELFGIAHSCCSRAIQVDYSAPLSELAQSGFAALY
jgi:hypothetical protein